MSKRRTIIFRIIGIPLALAGLSLALVFIQITSNSWHVHETSRFLKAYSFKRLIHPGEAAILHFESQLRQKSDDYIAAITANHLEEGLVVHRKLSGQADGICDSLLFSSLLFTSLIKLGYPELAGAVWEAISSSRTHKGFVRHPDCALKAVSRDQILGVMVALSQKPPQHSEVLRDFFLRLEHNDGFFSHGGPAVSYMTPGLADITRRFARAENIPHDQMPDSIRRSFSTLEASVPLEKEGYRTHLAALQIWLELELTKEQPILADARSITSVFSSVFAPFTPRPLESQRLEYLTQVLVERQPDNLFYRYLRYRAAGAWGPAARVEMIKNLLAMPQFPAYRLPADCDRKADYLWQRSDNEYVEQNARCGTTFHGVDFLWMSALLLEPIPNNNTAALGL